MARPPLLHLLSSSFILSALVMTSGCSGASTTLGDVEGSSGGSGSGRASSGSKLFDAPKGEATPGAIHGLWGGAIVGNDGTGVDTRWRLDESELEVAGRCTLADGRESEIVAVTVAARVTEEEIAILESKKDEWRDGDQFCQVSLYPRKLTACDERAGFERECFRLGGTTLTIYGDSPLDKLPLTKLAD
jgi:hypothetical protein